MDDDVAVKMLTKHILKFFKMSTTYFIEDVDKEKIAHWLAVNCVAEGWCMVGPENVRETLHALAINSKYIGGREDHKKTAEVLPKGSQIAIIKMGERIL